MVELVERLNSQASFHSKQRGIRSSQEAASAMTEAASQIVELTSAIKTWQEQWSQTDMERLKADARIAALEAKLAKQETTLWARFKDILSALEA